MSVGNATGTQPRARLTQAERRARTRSALLEAAAQGLSRHGYGSLVLEQVAADAGYTRGALYHQFADKADLALAVVAWVEETWYAEMAPLFADDADPVAALLAVARGHALYCRRNVARVMLALRVELAGQEHPVARAVDAAGKRVVADVARLIAAGRETGAIPAGLEPRLLALGLVSALEGLVIAMAGHAPADVELAERLARGVLGLPPSKPARGGR
jgi:AcrR family transcriptional regulator